MISDQTATLLSEKELYPDGANHPTLQYIYECPCGKGTVEYARVPGFDDDYTLIHCPACRDHYEVRTGWGHLWELIPKGSLL